MLSSVGTFFHLQRKIAKGFIMYLAPLRIVEFQRNKSRCRVEDFEKKTGIYDRNVDM